MGNLYLVGEREEWEIGSEVRVYDDMEDKLPIKWTYPDIYSELIKEVKKRGYL